VLGLFSLVFCVFLSGCGWDVFCAPNFQGLVFGLGFVFGLWHGVCLVVVVGAVFDVCCGWLELGCGRQGVFFKVDTAMLMLGV
jgi:hypothetical protein